MKNLIHYIFAFSLLLFISCEQKSKDGTAEKLAHHPEMEQLKVEIYDSAALAIIDADAKFEILAEGFGWSEGPVWVEELQAVLFSDIPANTIYQWSEKDSLQVYLKGAGHSGAANEDSGQGPNGLILDHENRLLICQHGDRRIARMDADVKSPEAQFISIAETYDGQQFNSPNDLAIDKAGTIYFTDPPYGRPQSKTGAIGINGVFKVSPGQEVTLLVDSLSRPNGIALSLDERILYVNQSDAEKPFLLHYNISEDGQLENGKILFDFRAIAKGEKGLPDGLKVHKSGHIFATGPGGVHIISPEGKLMASIKTGKATANCTFDSNQKYLYMTTTDLLIRVRLK